MTTIPFLMTPLMTMLIRASFERTILGGEEKPKERHKMPVAVMIGNLNFSQLLGFISFL